MPDIVTSDLYLRVVLSLASIVAVLGLGALLLRRYGLATRFGGGGKRRLGIVEAAAIDAKHRLVLVRRDATEHLVLIGPTGASVVESGIRPPAGLVGESTS